MKKKAKHKDAKLGGKSKKVFISVSVKNDKSSTAEKNKESNVALTRI